ncbi:hypothetical protein [Prescottella equi]|uniref:hypothetical protein n=1 Tax=Rhodococcus hoagii TaxID=43767 RepID=UPI00111C8D53|nr:hypothetical protein [Prescottella equi]
MSDYCWSLGPRIGDEGKPVCFEPTGHPGFHRSHPGAGWGDIRWGAPDMTVPEHSRDDYWTPKETR